MIYRLVLYPISIRYKLKLAFFSEYNLRMNKYINRKNEPPVYLFKNELPDVFFFLNRAAIIPDIAVLQIAATPIQTNSVVWKKTRHFINLFT